jgi:hypothetical protein
MDYLSVMKWVEIIMIFVSAMMALTSAYAASWVSMVCWLLVAGMWCYNYSITKQRINARNQINQRIQDIIDASRTTETN